MATSPDNSTINEVYVLVNSYIYCVLHLKVLLIINGEALPFM